MKTLQHDVQVRYKFLGRLYVWIFLTSVFLTTGLMLGSPRNLAVGAALASVILLQAIRLQGVEKTLRITRRHTPQCLEGDRVSIELQLESIGARRFSLVSITDRFAAGGRSVKGAILDFPPRASLRFGYRQLCDFRRGMFVLGPVQLAVTDELGLVEKTAIFPVFTDLLVCPRPIPADTLNLLGEGTAKHVGTEIIRRIGRSEEFSGVRQYRSGDAWRTIHWPTTARIATLHVKEFDRNAVTQVTIIADMFETGHAGIGAVTSFEQRLRAAGTLAISAIEKNHLVRLVGAQTPIATTSFGGGTRHLQALMQWLALRAPRGRGHIEPVLLEQIPFVRRGSTVALVLSSANVEIFQLERIVSALRCRTVEVIAVVVEDRSYFKIRADQTSIFADAPPLEELVGRLRLAGCRTYVLQRGTDLLEGLRDQDWSGEVKP
ncbi:MAG: DUF58 domain-containing protein [Candidatus Sumerlaeaceae bacterium]|jgi:uncharacterized protein (DUF58 family)